MWVPGSRWFEFLIKEGVFIAIQRLCLRFSKDVDPECDGVWPNPSCVYAGPGWPPATVALPSHPSCTYFTDLSTPTLGFLLWQATWAQATLPCCPVCPRRLKKRSKVDWINFICFNSLSLFLLFINYFFIPFLTFYENLNELCSSCRF